MGARGFGKDLRSFYFALRHHPEWFGRNATGRPLDQKFVRRWRSAYLGKQAFSHHNQHWMVRRVAGMGDQNSVDLASTAHANLLEARGLLPVKERLAWDQLVPRSGAWSGIYIEDWLFVCFPRRGDRNVRREGGERSKAVSEAYVSVGLGEEQSKHFDGQVNFKAW